MILGIYANQLHLKVVPKVDGLIVFFIFEHIKRMLNFFYNELDTIGDSYLPTVK